MIYRATFILLLFFINVVHALEMYGSDHKLIKIDGHYFILNLEVFELKDYTIGKNYKYKVRENTTFIDLANKLKVGYYELKKANPYINPFKVPANTDIIVPLEKKLPKDLKLNTIYISLEDKRLYYPISLNNNIYVITFPVGTGDEEYPTPTDTFKITEKKMNPDWIVPPSAKRVNPKLPPVVPYGSPENGLGTRALRLNNSSYMIHGTSKKSEKGVGMKISYGCIILKNEDIERLYDLVNLNTEVVILKDFQE